MNDLELRMYFFVPYNLSPIQQGIQAGHAALEYARLYGHTDLFKEFVENHKTWIILNGGTTRSYSVSRDANIEIGTLNQIKTCLMVNRIAHSFFEEPDLEFALTSTCFICDERVFNKEKYPDWDTETKIMVEENANYIRPLMYFEWLESIGGEKNLFLRELLKDKRLA